MDHSIRSPGIIRFGIFEVDAQAGELHKQGQKIRLQEQPLQILLLLLERPGEVVTREELRQKLWPGDTFVDFEAGLNTAVKKLRDALDDSADKPRFVETLPRRGYRFIGPVSDSLQLQRRMLGRYRVEEQIGAGGMGEVYRGRDDHLERDVALKLLPAGALADEAARKRFRKEALALSKLNHPNIETVHDFGTQDGVDYLVLEYIPGVTLDEKLGAGALQEKEIVALGTQLAEGLVAAHKQGVLHRDLKPKNLRVMPDGRLKILDFGLAKLLRPATDAAATASLSETQGLVGTLPYMAPEQLCGEKADARTDLYAAGLVLYEMATGQRAFREELAPRLTEAILHQALVPPRVVNPRISQELERLILKCLEKEPENRYQSARELGADLRRLGGFVPAPTVAPAAPSGVLWRRTMLAVSLTVVALAAIGVVYWLTRPPALPFEARDWVLIAQFENRTGEQVLSGALEYALERELSNSRFVNVIPRERINDTLRLMKKPLDTPIDQNLGREICLRDGGVRALITGRVEKLDTTYVLSALLVNPADGVTVASFSEEAEGQKEVVPALRRLSRRVREALGEELGQIQASEQKLEKVTTPSLRALQLYSQADGLVLNQQGWSQACALLRQAIEEDPEFASGHVLLAWGLSNLNRHKEAVPHFERALALVDTTTDPERYFILSSYQVKVLEDEEKTVQTLEVLARLYPDHYWAVTNLSHRYVSRGQPRRALPYTLRRADLRPNNFDHQLRAVHELLLWGDRKQAEPYLQRAQKLVSLGEVDPWRTAWLRLLPVHERWVRGDLAQALKEVTNLASEISSRTEGDLSALKWQVGSFYLTLGKIRLATEILHGIAGPVADAGLVAWALGDEQALRKQLRRAPPSHRSGILLARAGLLSDAEKAIANPESASRAYAPFLPFVWDTLARGELGLARGQTKEAIRLLEQAVEDLRSWPTAYFFLGVEALARAWEQQGNPAKALEVLESAADYKRPAVFWGPAPFFWMKVQLQRAQLYRKLGREGDAEEVEAELQKLLVYADPDHPILRQLQASQPRALPRR